MPLPLFIYLVSQGKSIEEARTRLNEQRARTVTESKTERERERERGREGGQRMEVTNDRYPLREFTILNHRAQLEPGQARIPSL